MGLQTFVAPILHVCKHQRYHNAIISLPPEPGGEIYKIIISFQEFRVPDLSDNILEGSSICTKIDELGRVEGRAGRFSDSAIRDQIPRIMQKLHPWSEPYFCDFWQSRKHSAPR